MTETDRFPMVTCFQCGEPTPAPTTPDPHWRCWDCAQERQAFERAATAQRLPEPPTDLNQDGFSLAALVLDTSNALDALVREATAGMDAMERKLTDVRLQLAVIHQRARQINRDVLAVRAELSHAFPLEDDSPF